MLKRREFLKTAGAAAAAVVVSRRALGMDANGDEDALHFSSESMDVQFSATSPELLSLNIDGLGKGRRGPSSVDATQAATGFKASARKLRDGLRVDYRAAAATADSQPSWTFNASGNRMVLTSQWIDGVEPVPLTFHFNLNQVHSTVLGVFGKDKLLAAPALLHFPGQGSMRLTASDPNIGLTYTSNRPHEVAALSLPAATAEQKHITYTLEATAIYPDLPGIAGDERGDDRFDAFRRNWLNALQLNPNYPALANNTASDTCAFCYYEFADIAALTPALADGLTVLDVMRQTLDRMLAGGTAYGMPVVPDHPCAASDTYPAMVIAAANCVHAGGSDAWLAANYEGIRGWTEAILATDTSGNGLMKSCVSGNSGMWNDGRPAVRPSNWWDTIGFGDEDAYGNALAYRALRNMTMLAKKAGKHSDESRYKAAADKLHGAYYQRFFDPATGVLGGWRSADGQLHDYYFLWLNGIAIHYGLVPKPEANAIMDRLMAKMKEVGYDRFDMGLPGNLITVALKDCVDKRGDGRFGCGTQPDNADGFQNYENGGATGAFAFFTLAALYDLGRKAEADAILFPMLEAYGKCGFEGKDAHGMSPDWRRWDGTSKGYEGYLTDNFYALFAVPLRQQETKWSHGFRPATMLT